jgi:hypothetical protein
LHSCNSCKAKKRKYGIIEDKIRLIKFEELDELLDLHRFLNPDDPDMKGSAYINELWKKVFNDQSRYYFVVEEDGVLVSTCTLII